MTMPATVAAIRDLIRSQREAHTMTTDPRLTAIRDAFDAGDITTAALLFDRLDYQLSAGGTPPEAWREGPDAPTDDTGDSYVVPHNDTDTVYCSRDGVVPAQDSGGCRLCDERGDTYTTA